MNYSVRYEKSCGLLLFRNHLVLLLHYPRGHWDFPKGHINANETEHETACRELHEETAIKEISLVDGFRGVSEYDFRRERVLYRKKVIYFIATTLEDQVVLSDEHQGFEWMPLGKAYQRLTFENSRSLLTRAEKHLLTHKLIT
ncbi:MAG: NUDIX domain-containing protein [Pseudomonadota bacterium]|nr:NUDIX domain-containing protein [Pseudomonadota bacterium]